MTTVYKLVGAELLKLGYASPAPKIFRAKWSSNEVEHFLYFRYGRLNWSVQVDFGIRNGPADLFATECMRLYGGEPYRSGMKPGQFDCLTRCSLGRLADWSSLFSLQIAGIAGIPAGDVAAKIVEDIEHRLLPEIGSISSADALLDLLRGDDEPCRWGYMNGAIRAAQIAYLGSVTGLTEDDLRETLKARHRDITHALRGSDGAAFLEAVFGRLPPPPNLGRSA
jgi:hypothetical protein